MYVKFVGAVSALIGLVGCVEGPAGPQGEPGEAGEQGPPGEPGVDGEDGRDGRDGANGRDGSDGRDGQDGEDGALSEEEAIHAIGVSLCYSENRATNSVYVPLGSGWDGDDACDSLGNGWSCVGIVSPTNFDLGDHVTIGVIGSSGCYVDYASSGRRTVACCSY